MLSPRPERSWDLVKQAGVTNVVALLNGAEQDRRMFASVGKRGLVGEASGGIAWGEEAIKGDREMFGNHGFKVVAIEDTPPMDSVRLGVAGRDEEIENVIMQIRAMASVDIPVLCYNWMALSSWGRTSVDTIGRGGARVTSFNASEADLMGPLVEPGAITEVQLWDALQYFLDAVIPVAEQVGVKLAMHPDDPPLARYRSVPRIMRSTEAFRRLLEMYPSASNCITLCQGNFALMEGELPAMIREFGERKAIAMVHFRDVRGGVLDFVETFHDEGKTDLVACMRAYADVGFAGPMRPDHVPTMEGESNERPGYATLGRLFAIGYIRGLEHSVFGKPAG